MALAHDWLVGLRGGEQVLDRLAHIYGPTRLYTLVNDGRPLTPAIDACDVVCSPLQRFPGATGRARRAYFPAMAWAVERLRVAPCDLLVSTSSAVMKSIRPPADVPHLCYCHSPARYVWGQTDDYAVGAGGGVRAFGLRLMRRRFRRWDRATAPRVTRFLANSAHTAQRIREAYDRDAHVVHPPVRTDYFTVDETCAREPWLLVVAALEPYKRTDLAIEAATRAGVPIRVAGSGSQRAALESAAGPNVEFLGRVDDDELRALYRRARALVHPQQEDFGIIAVEAQAAGCPVIAYGRGGATETVCETSGVFFDEQTVEAIVDAIGRLDGAGVTASSCRENALRFSEVRFDAAIRDHADALLGGATD